MCPTKTSYLNSKTSLFISDHTRLAFSKSKIELMGKILKTPGLVCLLLLLGTISCLSSLANMVATAHSPTSVSSCNGSDITCRVEAQLSDEDELPLDLELHRRILAGSIGYQSSNPNRAACNPNCGNPGTSYTGNGCTYKNHCSQ